MMQQCFYCQDAIGEGMVYHVPFKWEQDIEEKPMCKECYDEWLEGIKE
ncbi:hypothetical protein P4637_01570 [Halalkalibacterium halodurans]|jgi:hypothetical protein|uniref:BH1830 protein n=1 Tax=Halalkalibacterium halodurans (strain ATCC BAA-125 / DSM 18197 / FERM 7344 / JCM 9153 / C-125) TaxID=272558 RepID=Q9KBU4_HALH5|nr:hypothetical protein [Halalkalibacterium halodurans]MDY7222390.1 hypothetical protein [Halalkalibacterium halodurans]MDY7241611.1 hypothetical protein [Halalkalibacterium halodurans]MED4082303.1 hypothetical protein [Halalkalibacterium halodurans]MED4083546.1 hypothetical protein [Halalkalibacterium halodurans]MED4105859.1 hypothetical protein [Halalkalibacterium halodurans]